VDKNLEGESNKRRIYMMNQQPRAITWRVVGMSLGIYFGAMIGLVIVLSLVAILSPEITFRQELEIVMSWDIWAAILIGGALLLVVFALARWLVAWQWFIRHFPDLLLILGVIIIVAATKEVQLFGTIVAGFFWNISLLGVGIAVFALAISLFRTRDMSTVPPANELRQLKAKLNAKKEKLEQLEKLESEIRARTAALKTKIDKLYDLTSR
jgi:hypothetical protein